MSDFYLTSTESVELQRQPRSCVVVGKTETPRGEPAFVVSIEPPLPGSAFNDPDPEIREVLVTARLAGDSVFELTSEGVDVYVLKPRTIEDQTIKGSAKFEILAWGRIVRQV